MFRQGIMTVFFDLTLARFAGPPLHSGEGEDAVIIYDQRDKR